MFDFGHANEAQKQAISSTDGPVLITAGPGTGKTYTLVQRAIYLIEECNVQPQQILMATFTEKAAKELVTRITNELVVRNISVDINEMYIGTFHSLCLRIIKENVEATNLQRNFHLMDGFDQEYFVFRYFNAFRAIENFDSMFSDKSQRLLAEDICFYVNSLREELVNPDELLNDQDPCVAVLGNVVNCYQKMLSDQNLVDFTAIQTECYRLLQENPPVLESLHNQISYLMIDEYQDTNYIQEQLVFLLAGDRHNICVVGDDDQGLYRFRGATIRNILEFPSKFAPGECRLISLVTNYRSNSDIVNFYNRWMKNTAGNGYIFSWDQFRYEKEIEPHEASTLKSPAVVKLSSENDEDEWRRKILAFIKKLKVSGKLTDYNQLAFLFRSVKNERVLKLADFLEQNEISVYSPRSNIFFERDEIRLTVGCLMLMFPKYADEFRDGQYTFLSQKSRQYYFDCLQMAAAYLEKTENSELCEFINARSETHAALTGTTDYAFCGLLYQMFAFEPFSKILDEDLDSGLLDQRSIRNLATFTQIIGKFEYQYNIDVLDGRVYGIRRHVDNDVDCLFNSYLRLLVDEGVTEHEDEVEYAPSGCVSFLTIHQAKGMEFPVVIVDSLGSAPKKSSQDILLEIEDRYYERPAFEPYELIKYFDFWRLYYTAFSRAQDLLVLTCNETTRVPSNYFVEIYEQLLDVSSDDFVVDEFNFHEVKDVNIKSTFSVTSDITVYKTCALQYKYFKELEFLPVRQSAVLFGTLVHQTIEDIHRAVLNGEAKQVTKDHVTVWFYGNYASLSKSEHMYLAPPQRSVALKQVLNYLRYKPKLWKTIEQSEVDVSMVQQDYIVKGNVDLLKGEDGTVEVIEFKSEHKPDTKQDDERSKYNQQQLQLYAHMVEEQTGEKVSKMHLYYTAEEEDPRVSYTYSKADDEDAISALDETAHDIMDKDFQHRTNDQNTCDNCDFRFYCSKR